MKPEIFQRKSQKSESTANPVGVKVLKRDKVDFVPLRGEVAGGACSNYLKRGSQDGNDVPDWLVAGAQLSTTLHKGSVRPMTGASGPPRF